MSATPILAITQVAANQNQKELTINNAVLALENATQATLQVSMAGNAVTLSQLQLASAAVFKCSGQTAAATLTIPQQMRLFLVANSGSFGITVGAPSGSAVAVPGGATTMILCDGLNCSLVVSSLTTAGVTAVAATSPLTVSTAAGIATVAIGAPIPWADLPPEAQSTPLGLILPGKPGASAVYNLVLAQATTLPANLAGTVAYYAVLPMASASFKLNKISAAGGGTTPIATLTLGTGSHSALSLSSQAAVSLVAGDVLQLVAPSTQDATLSDIGITILAAKV